MSALTVGGGANITLSTVNASHFSISGKPSMSLGVSTMGNTAGSTGVTGTRVVLVGSQNISLSQSTDANGATISLSGNSTQSVQSQGVISVGVSTGGNTAGNTTVNSGQRLVFAGAGIVTLNQATGAGSTTISVSASQSVQAETQTFVGGIAGSNTTYTSGTVTITGVGGGVTVSSNTGQRIDISVAAPVPQSNQSLGIYAVGNTTGQSSSSTHDARTLSIDGAGMISVGWSNSTLRVSATQSVQTQGIGSMGVSTGGNTSGDTGVVTGRLVLAGGNNITLSGSTNGGSQTITISAPNLAGGGNFSGGVSNLGNTAGSTGITGTRLVLAGTNMVSLSQSTDANGGTVSINATQSVQTQGITADELSVGLSNIGNTAGNTTVQTGQRLVFSGQANITLSQATGAGSTTIGISAPTQSVQTQGITGDQLSIGVSTGGNTQGNTTVNNGQRFVLVGSNGITLSQATGAGSTTVTISGTIPAAQTNQTGGIYALGNTTGQSSSSTYDARTLSVEGAGMISVGWSNSSLRISATQSVQTQGIGSMGMSTGGNTSGDTGFVTGRLALAGGANITLSGSTNGGSMTVSISGGAGGGGGNFSMGVSNLGNTAGSTGVSGTRVVLVAPDRITLSQSTDANGATISFDELIVTRQRFMPFGINAPFASGNYSDAFMKLVPFSVNGGELVTASRVDVMGSFSVQTTNNATNTLQGTQTVSIGIYSKNGDTLSLYSSGSQTYSHSNTSNGNTSIYNGIKNQSVPLNLSLTPGDWWLATWRRSSSNISISEIKMQSGIVSVGLSGSWGNATNSSYTFAPGWGFFSNASFSTAMPSSIALSNVKGGITNSMEANVIPYALLLNAT